MARGKEVLIGNLTGVDAKGEPIVVRVYKVGRDYRITQGDRSHLCHPSVRSIPKVKAEALLVFNARQTTFETV